MTTTSPANPLTITTSRHFLSWLEEVRISVAITTYQAGKLILLGLKPDGRMAVFERTFARCMGMGVFPGSRSFVLATEYQMIRFDDVTGGQGGAGGHDAIYGPHAAWITGDVDAHEVAIQPDGRPLFVNTLFSCLAETSEGTNFKPLWRPPFITRLAAEDRCHLNGLAMHEGKPAYVTAVGRSDVGDGWRDQRQDGGMVIDVASGEVVAQGLSMPHSPRLRDGKLWVLNSGRGEFGYIDLASGRFEPVAFCPGYARGLTFVGRYALIGLSLAREAQTFQGLPLDAALESHGATARCGVIVVDTVSGDTSNWVRIEGVVRELFDVKALEGVRNAAVIGFKTDEIKHVISMDEDA